MLSCRSRIRCIYAKASSSRNASNASNSMLATSRVKAAVSRRRDLASDHATLSHAPKTASATAKAIDTAVIGRAPSGLHDSQRDVWNRRWLSLARKCGYEVNTAPPREVYWLPNGEHKISVIGEIFASTNSTIAHIYD